MLHGSCYRLLVFNDVYRTKSYYTNQNLILLWRRMYRPHFLEEIVSMGCDYRTVYVSKPVFQSRLLPSCLISLPAFSHIRGFIAALWGASKR
jgi:hypothetical protein